MSADLLLALYAVAASAVFTATYALGHRHGRAYVSDRTFGPIAAGLVRIEAASSQLEVLADEPCAPGYRCFGGCVRCEPDEPIPYLLADGTTRAAHAGHGCSVDPERLSRAALAEEIDRLHYGRS